MARISRVFPLALALFSAACGPLLGPEQTPTPSPRPIATDRQLLIFEQLYELIERGYVYSDYGGVDWIAEGSRARSLIERGLSDERFAEVLQELVAKLPEGTASVVTREQRISSELESSAAYEGIGAYVAFRAEPPRILLLSIIEGSPAQKAGLQPHDAIYAVDGQPVREEEGLGVIERVRGPAGSQVVLRVVSPGAAPREVRVTRGQVTAVDPPRGGIVEPGLIYLLVPVSADANLPEAIAGMLQTAADQGLTLHGMVLDLRIAGSSGTWPLAPMLALLNDGEMGFFVSRDEQIPFTLEGQDFAGSQSIPISILIGPDTSGASEVFAAAMQSSGRAQLLGLPTSGNVLSYNTELLPDGSQLSYASSSFATLDGRDLSMLGVAPDVLIELDWDEVEVSDDPVLSRGMELILEGN